jgi:hypothetical protein
MPSNSHKVKLGVWPNNIEETQQKLRILCNVSAGSATLLFVNFHKLSEINTQRSHIQFFYLLQEAGNVL